MDVFEQSYSISSTKALGTAPNISHRMFYKMFAGGFYPPWLQRGKKIPFRTNKTKAGGTVSRILSLPFSSITIYLGCGLPRSIQRPTRSISSEIKLLLGLAPNEVCIAASVTGRTVVSYTAISPLRLLSAVSFLLHFLSAPA